MSNLLQARNYHLFRVHPACSHDGCFRAATSAVPPGNDNGSARQHLRAGQLPHGYGTAVMHSPD